MGGKIVEAAVFVVSSDMVGLGRMILIDSLCEVPGGRAGPNPDLTAVFPATKIVDNRLIGDVPRPELVDKAWLLGAFAGP